MVLFFTTLLPLAAFIGLADLSNAVPVPSPAPMNDGENHYFQNFDQQHQHGARINSRSRTSQSSRYSDVTDPPSPGGRRLSRRVTGRSLSSRHEARDFFDSRQGQGSTFEDHMSIPLHRSARYDPEASSSSSSNLAYDLSNLHISQDPGISGSEARRPANRTRPQRQQRDPLGLEGVNPRISRHNIPYDDSHLYASNQSYWSKLDVDEKNTLLEIVNKRRILRDGQARKVLRSNLTESFEMALLSNDAVQVETALQTLFPREPLPRWMEDLSMKECDSLVERIKKVTGQDEDVIRINFSVLKLDPAIARKLLHASESDVERYTENPSDPLYSNIIPDLYSTDDDASDDGS